MKRAIEMSCEVLLSLGDTGYNEVCAYILTSPRTFLVF